MVKSANIEPHSTNILTIKLMSSLGGGGGWGIVCSGAPILKTSTGISGLCNKLLPLKLITVFNVMIKFN